MIIPKRRNLIHVWAKAMPVVIEKTGVNVDEMTNPENDTKQVTTARHIALLLLYEETEGRYFSRRQIAELFGLNSYSAVVRANQKRNRNWQFRKLYNEVKNGITWHDPKKQTT